MYPIFTAKNKAGFLQVFPNQIDAYREHLASMPEIIHLVVRPYKKKRSNPQNKYYWSVVVKMLSMITGYTSEEVHEVCRAMFLKDKFMFDLGEKMQEVDIIKSTSALTTVEFEEYLSNIKQWASESLSLVIPDPNESEQ